jgi:cytochrome c oxidase subunit II
MAPALKAPRRTLALGSAAAATFALALLPSSALAALTPPSPASPNADDTQLAYIVMVALTTLIGLAAIVGLIAAARGRGRRTELEAGEASVRRTRGTNAVQRRIGIALGALALVIFVFGVVVTESARQVEPTGTSGLTTAQKDLDLPSGDTQPLEITVSGQQWLWRYEYPDGTFSYYDLVVPVDTEVLLDVESTDVLHRWWIPALGGMFDAVPGQSNEAWFKADETGVYEGQSTSFSGPAYAQMRARVTVVEPDEYEAWLEQQAADIQEAQNVIRDRVEAGDTLAVQLEGTPADGGGSAADGAAPPAGGAAPAEGEPQG